MPTKGQPAVKLEKPQVKDGSAPKRRPRCAPADMARQVEPLLQRIREIRGRRQFVLAGTAAIDESTCDEVYSWRRELREAGEEDGLDILIHSPGGVLTPCYQIARLFASRTNAWEALVPSVAASGATLIALGSANIVMGEMACLGPIDPQVVSRRSERLFAQERQSPLEAFAAVRYLREQLVTSLDVVMRFMLNNGIAPKPALETAGTLAMKMVEPILSKIEPYDLGSFSLDSQLSLQYCERIANPSDMTRSTQRNVAFRKLVEQYPAHEFAIDLEEARALGFKVTTPTDELDELYAQIRPHLDGITTYIGFVPESEA